MSAQDDCRVDDERVAHRVVRRVVHEVEDGVVAMDDSGRQSGRWGRWWQLSDA
jgi:hypothetical protein